MHRACVQCPAGGGLSATPHNVTSWSLSHAWASGSATSTLHDLQIWAKALATGQLVSPVAHQEQLSFTLQSQHGYGLGVTNFFPGFVGHDGGDPGFQSFMGYQPQTGATIIVLTNLYPASDGGLSADPLAAIILKELFV